MGLVADARSIARRDPAARNTFQVVLLYSGFHALVYHRTAHFFFRHHRYFISRLISQIGRFFTGIEIHPGAKIGNGLFIDHGMGVVIGETAEVGDNCTIYHNVTLGGTGREKGKRHPTVGDNVLIGAGAKILGPFRIGSNSMIGANAVVLNEIPENATVVGVPGRIVRQWGLPVSTVMHSDALDHGSAPDPMEQDLCLLLHRVAALERLLGVSRHGVPGRAASGGDASASSAASASTASLVANCSPVASSAMVSTDAATGDGEPDDDSEACEIAAWPKDQS